MNTLQQTSTNSANYWPAEGHDQGVRTCGINCLIVLPKKMLATGKPSEMDIYVEENLFVQHARIDLSSDPATATQALDSLALAVWNKPLDQVSASELSFASLASSPAMAGFWSAPFCHPWRSPVWRWINDASWSPVDEDTPKAVVDLVGPLRVKPATFHFKVSPGMRLGNEIQQRFSAFGDERVQMLFPAHSAAFFYALFTACGVDGKERLKVEEFRTIRIRIQEHTVRSLETMRFNLLAIIKYAGDSDGDCDTIRVYNNDGSAEPPRAQDYASPAWRVADLENGDTFLAVYAKSWLPPATDPPFPEVAEQKKVSVAKQMQFETFINDSNSVLDGFQRPECSSVAS